MNFLLNADAEDSQRISSLNTSVKSMSIESVDSAPSMEKMLAQAKYSKIAAILRMFELNKPLNITNQYLNVNHFRSFDLSNNSIFCHDRATCTTAEISELKRTEP